MKLSSMQDVGRTIEGDDSSPIAREILSRWGFDKESIRPVRFSTNFIFAFSQQGVKRFLRFCPASERTVEALRAEAELLLRLAADGFQVAKPIPSLLGNVVETVDTDVGTFHAIVFTGLSGQERELAELSHNDFHAWGAALGRLHAAFQTYGTYEDSLKPERPRNSYVNEFELIREMLVSDDRAMRELDTIKEFVESLRRDENTFGLIHYDFELDNLCWDNGKVQMLDFDDSTYHWYVADIAFALRDLFDGEVHLNDLNDERFVSFLAGYRTQFAIDEESLRALPMFLRLRVLYGHAGLMRTVDLSFDETDDWLQPLHQKLTRSIENYQKWLQQL